MNKKSDIIDYDFAKNKGFKLLKDDKKCILRLRQFIFFNLSKYTKTGGLGAFTIKLDSQH
jgi:hypothetical protein